MTTAIVISMGILLPVTLLFENCSPKKFEIKRPELGEDIELPSSVTAAQFDTIQTSDVLTVSVSNIPEPMTKDTSVKIKFSVEPMALTKKVTCVLDGNPEIDCADVFSMEVLDEGFHKLKIQATDYMDKIALQTVTWTIDKTPPKIIILQKPLSPTNEQLGTNIIFSVIDSSAGVNSIQCSVDDSVFSDCVSPLELKNISAGSHHLAIRATDKNGNQITNSAVNWTVNQNSGAIRFASWPDALTSARTASFSYFGIDNQGGNIVSFLCGLDTTNLVPCDSETMTFDSLSPGSHFFSIKGLIGTYGQTAALTYYWTVDLEGPTIANIFGPNNCTMGACGSFLTFVVSDSKSEISAVKCSLNNSEPQDCTSPYLVQLPSDANGIQSIEIIARNKAGNTSKSTYRWTVTYANVQISQFLANKPIIFTGQSTTLFWETQNAVSATLNGAVVSVTGTSEVSPSQTTRYTLVAAGKSGAPMTREITVTVSAPPGSISVESKNTLVRAYPGTELTLKALVNSTLGQPIPNHLVSWNVGNGGGTLLNCLESRTNYAGVATCKVAVSTIPGANTFNASVPEVPTPAVFTVYSEKPSRIEIYPSVSGTYYTTGQTPPKVYPGTSVGFMGIAFDSLGKNLPGVPMTWSKNGSVFCDGSRTSESNYLTSAKCNTTFESLGTFEISISSGILSHKITMASAMPAKLVPGVDNYAYYPNFETSVSVTPKTAANEDIAGVPIEWAATSGGTLTSYCTSGLGRYSCSVKVGAIVGANTFVASSPGVPSITLTKIVDHPSSVTASDIWGSTHKVGYRSDIRVKAKNSVGTELIGVPVNLTAGGGATLSCKLPLQTGSSSCAIVYGNTTGTNTVTANVPETSISHTLTITLTAQ
jgi:hypothetical protein